MDTALQVVAAGISNGAVYGISTLGIVVVYRVARIVNLAQGEAITIGALATWWLDQQQGGPGPWPPPRPWWGRPCSTAAPRG